MFGEATKLFGQQLICRAVLWKRHNEVNIPNDKGSFLYRTWLVLFFKATIVKKIVLQTNRYVKTRSCCFVAKRWHPISAHKSWGFRLFTIGLTYKLRGPDALVLRLSSQDSVFLEDDELWPFPSDLKFEHFNYNADHGSKRNLSLSRAIEIRQNLLEVLQFCLNVLMYV